MELCGVLLYLPLLKSHIIQIDRMSGCKSLAVEPLLTKELGIAKQTFSRVISPPRINQSIQPMPSFKTNLILTITPTTISYTYNQLLGTDAVLKTPDALA